MFKSIRWTLQLWHAAILLLAVVSFGAAMYVGVARARYHAVDAELEGAARAVIDRLQSPPPPRQPPPPFNRPQRPGDDRRPPPPPRGEEGLPGEGFNGPPAEDFDGPPPLPRDERDPRRPPPPVDEPRDRRGQELGNVPSDYLKRVGDREEDQPYYVVWRPDGSVFRASKLNVPSPGPAEAPERVDAPRPESKRPPIRDRDGARELILSGPRGTRVLVGRSTAREAGDLRQLLGILMGSGAGVMCVGLVGGWLLAGRAIRPIHLITRAARSISSTDLSRRIEGADTQSELGALAQTLNETFARLEAAFQRQSQFTADASHELRTPLSVMHANLELALTRDRTGEEYRQTVAACLRASRRMTGLVESLLVLARADAGRLELRKEMFNVSEVAADCAAMLENAATEKKVNLETDVSPANVFGDRTRLAQVITNLLANAIHYNRPGGTVKLTVQPNPAGIIVRVADTGIGINDADLPHVFERFFRADESRSRDAGGSGLGLAICKSIIEAHAGTITVQSRAGEGTTFEVTLPAGGVARPHGSLLPNFGMVGRV